MALLHNGLSSPRTPDLTMSLKSLRLRLTALFLSLLVVACGGGTGSSAPAPADFAVAEGNGQVTITWTAAPGVDYWLMYAATATPINLKSPPGLHLWLNNVTSPLVIPGLTNGQSYSFAMDARTNGGPGGTQTPSVTKVPRLGGASWVGLSGLPNRDFKGVAYGTASDASVYNIAVGSGAAIYKRPDVGTDVALWTTATTAWADSAGAATAAPSVDFRSAVYTLGQFIAVGANGGTSNVYHSTDLSTWTASATAITSGLNAVASNGSTVVAAGEDGKLWWSTDGATWTPGTRSDAAAPLLYPPLYGVAYLASGSWAAVGQGGVLLTSADGKAWTRSTATLPLAVAGATLRAIAAIGSTWVAVGEAGTLITSTDSGATWADHSVGTADFFAVNASVTTLASLSQFLVVGGSGVAYSSTSADASSWTRQSTDPLGRTMYGLWGSATHYVGVGAAGMSVSAR